LLIFLIEFNEVKRSVIDRTAKRYGSLIALERVKNTGNGTVTTWKCKCDCGSIGLYKAMALERTIGINCGCVPESERDEPGKRFGRLTVVSRAPLTEENCKATGYKKIMRVETLCGTASVIVVMTQLFVEVTLCKDAIVVGVLQKTRSKTAENTFNLDSLRSTPQLGELKDKPPLEG
jgi:hypothetical protein